MDTMMKLDEKKHMRRTRLKQLQNDEHRKEQ